MALPMLFRESASLRPQYPHRTAIVDTPHTQLKLPLLPLNPELAPLLRISSLGEASVEQGKCLSGCVTRVPSSQGLSQPCSERHWSVLPSLSRCTRNKEQQKNSHYLYLARKAAVKTGSQWAWKCQTEDLNEAGTASTEEQSQGRGASTIDK